MVIDRIKVRHASTDPQADRSDFDNLKQRLAESFEAALRVANGRAIAVEFDSALRSEDGGYKPKEHLFNAKFACPVCSYSIAELESRLFSFNSPMGACPNCDGLGSREFFDPARVVAFPSLGLSSGAIKGWDRRNAYYFAMLESLAAHYKFDIERPGVPESSSPGKAGGFSCRPSVAPRCDTKAHALEIHTPARAFGVHRLGR